MNVRHIVILFIAFIMLFVAGRNANAITRAVPLHTRDFSQMGPQNYVVGIRIEYRHKRTNGMISTNYCTGSILDSNTILSAAHCFIQKREARWNIVVAFGPEFGSGAFYTESIAERDILVHPAYDFRNSPTSGANLRVDLAVVKLRTRLPDIARPVKLPPTKFQIPLEKNLFILGYGTTKLDRTTEASSDWGHLRLAENHFVDENGEDLSLNIEQKGISGLCTGDSGSPALLPAGSEFSIVGVAKSVRGDLTDEQNAELGRLGLKKFLERNRVDLCDGTGQYLDIRPHLDWIKSHI